MQSDHDERAQMHDPSARGIGLMLLLIFTWGVIACEPGGAESEHKAAARAYLQGLLIDRQWDRWEEYFSPGVSFNGTTLARPALKGSADGLHAAFPDLSMTIEEQIAEGDRVATVIVLRGTHTGVLNTLAPSNAKIAFRGVAIDRFENGRIVESLHQIDIWSAIRQIVERSARASEE